MRPSLFLFENRSPLSQALLILFCYTSISLGGLGFSEVDIGKALACAGVLTVVSQVSLFPPLQTRLGTIKLYRALMALYPFVFSLFPIMSHVASQDAKNGRGRTRVWYLLVLFLLLKAVYVLLPPASNSR